METETEREEMERETKWQISFTACFYMYVHISMADLFYGGESHNVEQPQSLTCPLCGQLGFSEAQLREHVTKNHGDSGGGQEVICPVCAAHPSGDPNHLTDDFPSHLIMEHRPPRDYDLLISFSACSIVCICVCVSY